jgi:hypothetical protein
MDGKKLNKKLGPWTGDHSRSGRWESYKFKDSKVNQFRNNEQDDENGEHQYWDVYMKVTAVSSD